MQNGLFYRWLSLPTGIRLVVIALAVIIPITFLWRYTHGPEPAPTRLVLDEEQASGRASETEQKNGQGERAPVTAPSKSSQGNRLIMDDDEPILGGTSGATKASLAAQKELDGPAPEEPTAQKRYPSLTAAETPGVLATQGETPLLPRGEATSASSSSPDSIDAQIASVLEEVPQGQLNSPVKLAHYRFLLASTTYETSPTKQNHLERVASLERLTQVACMRRMLNSLAYREPPQEPLCLAAIDKLLSLNPGSTSAICARDGIDSPSCLAADADTTTRTDSAKGGKTGGENPSSEKFRSLKGQLAENLSLSRNSSRGVSEQQRMTARSDATEIASQLLGLACTGAKVFVRERPVVKVRDFSNSRKDPYGLSELLETQERLRSSEPRTMKKGTNPTAADDEDAFGKPRAPAAPPGMPSAKPTPEKTSSPLGLVYLISSDCASIISTARSLDPALPALVCAERGRYSPRCIQAIRSSQAAAKGSKGSADEFRVGEEEGFARF